MAVDSRNGPKVRANIYLEDELLRQIKMIAVARGISDSDAFVEAAKTYVKEQWPHVEKMISK